MEKHKHQKKAISDGAECYHVRKGQTRTTYNGGCECVVVDVGKTIAFAVITKSYVPADVGIRFGSNVKDFDKTWRLKK